MRIISGKFKGRKLKGPSDLSIRPTLDRVKESIFNVLGSRIYNSSVLDLFAGSGSLGIEALSRGAETVYFIDNSFDSVKLLKENLALLKDIKEEAVIRKQDVAEFLSNFNEDIFEVIFLDPPFKIGKEYMIRVFNLLYNGGIIDKNSVIIYEFFFKRDIEEEICLFNIDKVSSFGEKKVIYLSLK
ncbi:MAG TPA: 16S rRNA (guanine(966)-N(2))-methyltransferase RsmD [Actinobacteria bacterium]|nr:16S rRNA (guanine(966)-N(2))-methyltransferase RsmD [Actinomycetota bacterium]